MRKKIILCLAALLLVFRGAGAMGPQPAPAATSAPVDIVGPVELPDAVLHIDPPGGMPIEDQSEGGYSLYLVGDGENIDLYYIFTAEQLEGVPLDYTFDDFSEEGLDSIVLLLDLFESGMEMSYQEGEKMLGLPTLRIFSDPFTQYQWALLRHGWLYTGGVFSLSEDLTGLEAEAMLGVFTLEAKE